MRFTELGLFLSKHKWKPSKLRTIYLLSMLSFALLLGYQGYSLPISITQAFIHITFGVVIALCILPIHELIHYFTFRAFGAKNISIKLYFKQLYFLTIADRFFIDSRKMKWIALMPFILISATGLVALYLIPSYYAMIVSSALLFHTNTCKGDYRLLDFQLSHAADIILYTEEDTKTTYFLQRTV